MSVLAATCSVDGCPDRIAGILTNKCPFHDSLATARNLTPEQFDRLRDALATTPPISDEERRTRRVKAVLARVEWTSRDLRRQKLEARSLGAAESQIKDAVRRGRAAS